MAQSRTAKSLKNSSIALVMYFFNVVLQFFSRKVFLDYLGTEVLGLNTTATNLLGFLNLAELGIGSAIACTLYKPLFENNRSEINEIIALQGQFYKRIALLVIGGAVVLGCFFSVIFNGMQLPLCYAYASFGVLLFSSLLGYFVNYKQVLLTADQQDYKVQYTYRLSMIVKVLCQMVAMYCLSNPYLWWLILEVVFAIIGSVSLSITINKTYPYLCAPQKSFKELRDKYPYIVSKVKQLFVHKVSGFALFQFSPLIIYYYATLSLVTIYGNYVLVITGITMLINTVFNSVVAGIGNLLSESPDKAYSFFVELFSLRFFVASLGCFLFYTLTSQFVTLWIGEEYLLPKSTLLLLTVVLFVSLIRQTIDNYINAYGLFSDVWAPFTEMMLNLGFSIVLGRYWNLNGVVMGMIISQTLIMLIWKPYFLFNKGIGRSVLHYWKSFLGHAFLAAMAYVVVSMINRYIHIQCDGFVDLIVIAFVESVLYGGVLLLFMNITKCGIRQFEIRIYKLLRVKIIGD